MIIRQLIDPSVPTLSMADTGTSALALMEQHQLHQLPLVGDEVYLALVDEDDIRAWETPEQPLSNADFLEKKLAVLAEGHPFEALRIANNKELDIVPVIDPDGHYVGAITLRRLMQYITESSGIDNPGGIIILEVAPRDYNLSEIARICENEEVSILSLQLHSVADGRIEITLKTNRTNITALANAFERYGMQVNEVYTEHHDLDDIKERYGLLMNYINM